MKLNDKLSKESENVLGYTSRVSRLIAFSDSEFSNYIRQCIDDVSLIPHVAEKYCFTEQEIRRYMHVVSVNRQSIINK